MVTTLTKPGIVPCPIMLVSRAQDAHAARAATRGEYVRVIRGVYAPRARWIELRPWERYLARVHAVALRDPDAVFCLASAAALRGLPVFLEPAEVHVLSRASSTSRAVSGVRTHVTAERRTIDEIDGMLVCGVADIVVDIARHRHNAIGLAVASAALRADADLSIAELRALNEDRCSARWRRHARWPLARATPVPESTLESVSLATIEWLGIEPPELQKWFRGPTHNDRSDFWWKATRTAGEADGDLKYDGTYGDATEALRERRARDARLHAQGAAATVHWSWSEAIGGDALQAVLAAGGVHPAFPRDVRQLHSLRAALAPRTSPRPRTS
ncbi:hypothetical protein [Microbacterium sp.]|uniref:hypothetical protein n=1 Tax=Microbacterium sp. TaxID=51671 RepID=UPI0039E66A67